MPETKISLDKIQRIKNLQLQGFTPDEASKMQSVELYEVLKVYNEDKVFLDEKATKVLMESVKKND